MDVDVEWPAGPWLEAEVTVTADTGGAAIGTIEVMVDRGRAYAFYDAVEAARAAGEARPDPRDILMPEQRRTLVSWPQRWPALEVALAAATPPELQGRVTWISLWLTDRVRDDMAIARLTGVLDPGLTSPWGGDELEALVVAGTVLSLGRPGTASNLPASRHPEVPLRAHPGFEALSREGAAAFIAREDWAGLEAALDGSDARRMVDAALVDWLLDLPEERTLARLPDVQHLLLRSDAELPGWMDAMGVSEAVQQALVRVGRYAPPPGMVGVLPSTPSAAPEPAAEPAPAPEPLPAPAAAPPVVATRRSRRAAEPAADDPLAFLQGMVLAGSDEEPGPAGGLDDAHDEDDWDDEGPQQEGLNVLAIWLEREWIELTDDANAELVRFSLESLLDAHDTPDAVINGLFEVPGVEEVYVDDDALEEFMAAW